MRRLALLAGAAALLLAAPGAQAAGKPGCNKIVKVVTGDDAEGNLFFRKSKVTIRKGSCVRWVWTGTLDHQVKGKGFQSKQRTAPYSYRRRYAKARKRAFHPLRCGCGSRS